MDNTTLNNATLKKPILGISLDGVLRDFNSQFDKTYRKFFIKNDSLVQANDDFTQIIVTDEDENQVTEEQSAGLKELDRQINEKINLPVDSYDLLNHYSFESKEEYEKFFQEYAFELFGTSGQFPRAFDTANRLQNFGKATNMFEVILLIKGTDKIVSSTYHFLAKCGCKTENVRFVENHIDKWNYCDVLIDDAPESFESKPQGKKSIKISHLYNSYNDADYSFDNASDLYNEMFWLKIFRPEKYLELTSKKG